MMGTTKQDGRVDEIIRQVTRYASGDFSHTLNVSGKADEIDAVISSLNALGDVLKTGSVEEQRKEQRINHLLEILLKYTVLDFSSKARISSKRDEIDALAAGLNALAEELGYHHSKLRDSEEQIQTIFRNAPDAVIVMNEQGIIVRWNPAAENIFGWREEEVEGKLLHEILIPQQYREKHVAGLARFLQSGEGPVLNKTLTMPALRKNNSELEVELTISPARLKDHYIFVSFLRDITERKRAEDEIKILNTTLEQRVRERTLELYHSERKYKNLFANNPMPLWVIELPSFRFLDVNESAITQYGYSREEFLSMTALDIRPEDDKKRFLEMRANMGRSSSGVWRHRKKDGSLIYAEVTGHEILFDGKPARLVISYDITERRKAEEALMYSEARLRRIFESKLIGFAFWNAAGEITAANDVFLEMIDYTRDDLQGTALRWSVITPPEYSQLDDYAQKQLELTGVCEPFEKEIVRKDGERIPILVGSAALSEGLPEKGVSYIMDISQRKKMQEEILALNRDLEQRVTRRTEELETAIKELESFSYTVSHDLRAPLRAINGYAQMLMEDYTAKLDEEALRLLQNIKNNSKWMGQLVDNLLEFSRVGKRELALATTNLTGIAEDVSRRLHHEGVHRAKIIIHELGAAEVDVTLLRNVFENLISNAIKYSAKTQSPVIEIGTLKVRGTKTYYVKDNGAGFDMAYYNKLFGVFHRLHQQDEFEGTGVGLAIVQRIINRHGGKVWAEGKVGEGATFYFTLK